jgi:hypothetical protein
VNGRETARTYENGKGNNPQKIADLFNTFFLENDWKSRLYIKK